MAKAKNEESTSIDLALVLGYIAVKDFQNLEERVRVLARLGYGNQEIARICDTTPLTVAVRKSGLKKRRLLGRK